MVTLRRLTFVAVLLVLMLLTGVFAYSNPEPIDVDIGLVRFEQVSMAVAFAVVVAFGWLLGLLSAGIALWRSAREILWRQDGFQGHNVSGALPT